MVLNTQLLLKIKKQILSDPKSFNMGTWRSEHKCGTTMCIAGWAITLDVKDADWSNWSDGGQYFASFDRRFVDIRDDDGELFTPSIAEEVLGLKDDRLFYFSAWDEPFSSDFEDTFNIEDFSIRRQKQAEIAANYIDYYIANKAE